MDQDCSLSVTKIACGHCGLGLCVNFASGERPDVVLQVLERKRLAKNGELRDPFLITVLSISVVESNTCSLLRTFQAGHSPSVTCVVRFSPDRGKMKHRGHLYRMFAAVIQYYSKLLQIFQPIQSQTLKSLRLLVTGVRKRNPASSRKLSLRTFETR